MLSKPLQAPLSRYAAPSGEKPSAYGAAPSFNMRIAVLATLAVALLIALILGLRSLYHATSSDTAEPTESAVAANAAETPAEARPDEAKPAKATPEAKPAKRAEPQKIPSLYID